MTRCVAPILLILGAVLGAALPASAQSTDHVTGTVSDATALPLPGVTVTLRGPVERSTLTNSNGAFELAEIRDGVYELLATREGFAPLRRTIRVTAAVESRALALTLSIRLLDHAVVTAARAGEALVETMPMAVSVLSGATLERTASHTIAQLAGLAPSVTFSQNTGFAQLSIRGIGTNAVFAGSDPSSAVYLDGVYLARPAMVLADFVDLERVEVLRGPQGTLYGRNAVGGAINLITKPPTNEFDASARFTAGGGHTLRADARVQGPIVRGRVMGAAAFVRGVRRGFVRDVDHPDHPLGGDDVTAARGQVRVVLNARSELLLASDFTHQDPRPLTWAKVLAVKPAFEGRVDNPPDFHDVRTSTLAVGRNLQYGGSARFSLDLTPTTRMTSLSAFRRLDYDRVVDTDITELELNATHIHERQHQLSEEITVAQRGGPWTWIAGVFLFSELDRQPTTIQMAGAGVATQLNPRVEAGSAAVFGQATIQITPTFSATAGVRYTRERKTIENEGRMQTLEAAAQTVAGSPYAYTDSVSHDPWTPKLGLEMRTLANALVYVSATKGFKSGGFNLTSPETGLGYNPEFAWSYEAGVKAPLANGRAMTSVAAFQTDYTDLQVSSGIRPGVIDIANAAAATIRGVELEGTARLGSAVAAGGHLTWLDARYDRYIATGIGGVMGDVAGNRLNNAPVWSGRAWTEWTAGIGAVGVLSLRAESTWQSTVFFTPFNGSVERQAPYGLLGVSAEFAPHQQHWSISAYARNLTDENYVTGTFSTPVTAIGGRPADPRQMGVQFELRR